MFCIHCGSKNKLGVSYCAKCGESLEEVKDSFVKNKASSETGALDGHLEKVKNAGTSTVAFGWFTIIINLAIYLIGLSGVDMGGYATDLASVTIVGYFSYLMVVFGKRVKECHKDTRKYLYTIVFVTTALAIYVVWSGGKVGFLLFLLFIYLVSALVSMSKIEKDKEYLDANFKSHKYSIGLIGWVLISLFVAFLSFLFAVAESVINDNTASSTISNTSSENKSDWKTYTSIDGKFNVFAYGQMNKSEVKTEKVGDQVFNYVTYSFVDKNGDEYMVVAYDTNVSSSIYIAKDGIEGGINEFVNGLDKSTLKSVNYSTFMGYQAGDFVSSYDGRSDAIKGKLIIKDDSQFVKMYLLVGMGNVGEPENYQKFVNSFLILK